MLKLRDVESAARIQGEAPRLRGMVVGNGRFYWSRTLAFKALTTAQREDAPKSPCGMAFPNDLPASLDEEDGSVRAANNRDGEMNRRAGNPSKRNLFYCLDEMIRLVPDDPREQFQAAIQMNSINSMVLMKRAEQSSCLLGKEPRGRDEIGRVVRSAFRTPLAMAARVLQDQRFQPARY